MSLSHNEKNSTLKYLSFLLTIFLVSFTVIIIAHVYFLNLMDNLDKKTHNLESKIKISNYIIEDISKIRSNFFEMSAETSNKISIELFQKKIKNNIDKIEHSLNILNFGGTISRVIALNIANKSSTKENITYTINNKNKQISINELGIHAKLSEFKKITENLAIILHRKNQYMKEKNIQIVKTIKKIKRVNKSMPSFFNRINEDINKIILNSESNLNKIRVEVKTKKKEYSYIEFALILGTLLISLFFALKIAKQIFKMNKILKYESKKLQAILDSTDNIVIVTDGEKINLGNDAFLNFFGYESIDTFSQKYNCVCERFLDQDGYFSLKSIQQDENWIEYMQKLKNTKKIITMTNNNLELKSFSVSIKENKKEEYKYIISFTDITDIKTESKKFEVMATYDSLTKIFNRQKFNEIFNYELDREKRYKELLSLIILDIDLFKRVNDSYGHDVGDNVLVNFANLIKQNIRIQDTFARWGGEEFVILLPKTDMQDAMLVAEKLRKVVEESDKKDIPKITVSLGVTLINSKDTQKSAFIRVDKALYEAKENGRNRVVFIEDKELALL